MSGAPEAWLRGAIEGVTPHLMPVAHALTQAAEDLERVVPGLSGEELRARPGGAASIEFHLRHIPGVIDRLTTYARGEMLSDEQLATLRREKDPADPPAEAEDLLRDVRRAIDEAVDQLRRIPQETLLEAREVGRVRLPSTVLGLLYHVGEHVTRHTGQIITTAKVIRGPVRGSGGG